MVEEDGVEPPFFPNFTMQLSRELIRSLISKKAYQQEGFLPFYFFTFLPLIHFTHSVRPAFRLPPCCRDTLPGSFVNPVFLP